jgi:hypothetical protein
MLFKSPYNYFFKSYDVNLFRLVFLKMNTRHIPIPYITYYDYFNHFKVHIQKLLLVDKSKTLTSKVHNIFTLMNYAKQFISSFL